MKRPAGKPISTIRLPVNTIMISSPGMKTSRLSGHCGIPATNYTGPTSKSNLRATGTPTTRAGSTTSPFERVAGPKLSSVHQTVTSRMGESRRVCQFAL